MAAAPREKSMTGLYFVGGIAVLGGFFAFANWRYRTCPPNELLVVYGLGGNTIKKGGGAFVLPIVQQSKTL